MMGNTLAKSAVIDFGIQWACWVFAAALKTEKFYDLAGSLTFILLTAQSFKELRLPSTRQKVNSGMVMIWAIRLGTFLFSRVLREGKDSRFDVVKNKPGLFWIYWTIQGVWILSTLSPTLIVNSKKVADDKITTQDYAGWGLWIAGFLLEVIADYQKTQFRHNPENAGKWISSGLWSVSRHPNYLGEILMWLGLYVSSSSVLRGWEHLSVVSPVLLTLLITRLSGIPPLEAAGRRRWGGDPGYQAYLSNTAKLIPFIW